MPNPKPSRSCMRSMGSTRNSQLGLRVALEGLEHSFDLLDQGADSRNDVLDADLVERGEAS